MCAAHNIPGPSKKSIRACSIISDTGDARWEQLMKNFTDINKVDKTRSELFEVQMPRVLRAKKDFPTGSSYHGSWNLLGLSGYGVYVYPNGVEYRGSFEDGEFHGEGELLYKGGSYIKGIFRKGELVERNLVFIDDVKYEDKHWEYCKMPDRRYKVEIDNGLEPAGNSYITCYKPSKEIPNGHYDTGDGFYNPKTRLIYNYEDPSIDKGTPIVEEEQWIIENCRAANVEHKPCGQYYEEWIDADCNPIDPKPPSTVKTIKDYKYRDSDVSNN